MLRMLVLEVLDDRERFGQMAAVVEFEHRQPTERIDVQELRRAVLTGREIDRLARYSDAFLGEVHAHLLRIRRAGEIVEFHR
jgi:hypothetical protein